MSLSALYEGSNLHQLYPYHKVVAVDDVYRSLRPHDTSSKRLHVWLNMVTTVDGHASLNGSASGLGSPTDHALLRQLRAATDVIVHGAQTVRTDRLGLGLSAAMTADRVAMGKTPQPLRAMMTRSGNIPIDRLTGNSTPIVVFALPAATEAALDKLRVVAKVHVVPDLSSAISILGDDYDATTILFEGGPTLNRSLLEAHLLDELFLTVSPTIVGGTGLTLVTGEVLIPSVNLRLVTMFHHESELFLRYAVVNASHDV